MPDTHLPIYEIQDFSDVHQHQYFYLSNLLEHLQKHLFIQKPHKHNFYILVFFTQGSGTHTIDFQDYPVAANTVFFLTPGQVHSWQLSDTTDGYILFFTSGYYLLGYSLQKLYSFPFYHSPSRSPYLALKKEELSPLLQSLALMKAEDAHQHLLKHDLLRDYLDIILIQLTRLYYSYIPQQNLSVGTFPQLQSLELVIDRYFKEHQPITFYADKLHLTPKQLNEYSKKGYGKTTTELIQDRIILEAKRLLVHSALTVAQVAAELGYFDNAYFFRFFKKHTGQTPEQFRKEHL